jgi:hypothetical protein
MSTEPEEYILIWEAPKIVKPEFRLYYDDKGHVVCYTCEKLEGNYIVIDNTTYAEGRPDVRVVDGRLVRISSNAVVSKLVPDKKEGQSCAKDDVSIILSSKDKVKKQKWKLVTYEL